MQPEFRTIMVESIAAAAVGYMQASVYLRLFPTIPRILILCGYGLGYVAAYVGLLVGVKLAEPMREAVVWYAHTLCTALLGSVLFVLFARKTEAPARLAWACGIVVLLSAAIEWTLWMTISPGKAQVWTAGDVWLDFVLLQVVTTVFFGFYLLLLYTIWSLLIQKKPAGNRYMYGLLLASQMLAFGVLLYQGEVVNSNRVEAVLLMSAVVFIAANLGIYYGMRVMRRFERLRRQSEAERRYVENQADYYEALANQHAAAGQLRSNMRRVFHRAIELLEKRELETFRALFESDSRELGNVRVQFCENTVVNALFLAKKRALDAEGIAYRIRVTLEGDTCFDDLDLCNVFGNVLDNAIEACRLMIDFNETRALSGRPSILLEGFESGGFYVIRCRNRCSHRPVELANGRFQSGKRAEGEHGLGMLIVEEIANKYSGQLRVQCVSQDGELWFHTHVYLGVSEDA